MKVLTVVGARPQFVKAAVVSRAFAMRSSESVREVLLHTGQHYDESMSDVFFRELQIPKPDYNLGIGGGTHGQNTGRMIESIESVLLSEHPDAVLVYGDTDSTLAGALAAAKLHIPVVHVEAGLRSFNRSMPEEINRVLTDHVADLLLTPSETADRNLEAEGIQGDKVVRTGDVMYDAALFYAKLSEQNSRIISRLGLEVDRFVLATLHRPSNTDDEKRLTGIVRAFDDSTLPVVFPLHPRVKARIEQFNLTLPDNVITIPPVGYLDMVALEKNASMIVTDSGGVQKEAFFHATPCLTVREETEWTELVSLGVNLLIGHASDRLRGFLRAPIAFPSNACGIQPYGDGRAGDQVVAAILRIRI
jgi:UDP-GlcNAc3NAcA epimerase